MATDSGSWEDYTRSVTVTDGEIKLDGINENVSFVDSSGTTLATLKSNTLKQSANGITLIDTTGYGKSLTLDNAFAESAKIKTVDGTFTYLALEDKNCVVSSEGKVSNVWGTIIYSGGINLAADIFVPLSGITETTVNGATFKTSDGTISTTENSAYAYSGHFIVTDSLNLVSDKTVTVKDDSDGVSVNVNLSGVESITGLSDGGTVEYNGKTYTRKGNNIFSDGKYYSGNDSTNLLKMSGGKTYYEVTDSIDITKLSKNILIVDAQKNSVATYDGTTLKVTGDISLTSITGLKAGGSVEYNGKTYTNINGKIFNDGKVYSVNDTTNILSMTNGADYYEVTDSIDIGKLSKGVLIVDAQKNSVATYDGKNLKVTGDISLTSITGLSDGGTVTYDGKTYSRARKIIFSATERIMTLTTTQIF